MLSFNLSCSPDLSCIHNKVLLTENELFPSFILASLLLSNRRQSNFPISQLLSLFSLYFIGKHPVK